MGINIRANLSKEDIRKQNEMLNPPAYDAGDDVTDTTNNQLVIQDNEVKETQYSLMRDCPKCGSKLYFENVQGIRGPEDRCYSCDYCREHLKIEIISRSGIFGIVGQLRDLFKIFEVQPNKR